MFPSVSNQVTLIGRLGDQPELFGKDRPGDRLHLGVARSFTKDGRREERVDWFTVICGSGLARSCRQLAAGDLVAVAGALRTELREDRGEICRFVEVEASSVEVLGGKALHDSPNNPRS